MKLKSINEWKDSQVNEGKGDKKTFYIHYYEPDYAYGPSTIETQKNKYSETNPVTHIKTIETVEVPMGTKNSVKGDTLAPKDVFKFRFGKKFLKFKVVYVGEKEKI